MNKKIAPILIVIAILAVGGYYLKTKKTDGHMTSNQMVSEASEFAKAMESGKPAICTMTKGDDVMEYTIKGKSMRMKSISTVKDDEGNSIVTTGNMINDTKYLYVWDDKTKQGSKTAIPTEEETKAMAEKAKEYQSNIPTTPTLESQADYDNLKDEGYTIDCKSDNVEDSVFTVPTDVKFIDPTEMMKNIPAMGEEGQYDMSQIQELQKKYESMPSAEDQ